MTASSRRNRLIALAATLLCHALLAAVLLALYLRYNPADAAGRTWPPVDSAEVLLGGEYVMIGDTPAPTADDAAQAPAQMPAPEPPQAESTHNTGTPAPEPSPILTSERPSPAKAVKSTPQQPTGPSKAELEAAERAKREEEARRQIASRVQFGKSTAAASTSAAGSGKSGSPDGNSATGALSGTPGYNLKGRTMDSWQTPPRGPLGTITVRVSVNRQGAVTQATYQSGTGAAAANETSRAGCIRAAMASRFSVDNDAPAVQTGTITYRFQ